MPSAKSLRVSQRRAVRNKAFRTAAKTRVVAARRAISSGQRQEAEPALARAASALDRAATKGSVHRNTAARRKSRLARQINRLGPASPEAPPGTA
ncbi:MAG: 30S ribosomal protein S20 [Chloroflexi bacterium]|nr:30S ribosomal protein S20 [Chloroflexota bacterium]